MAILTVASPFANADQVTSTKLNNLVSAATFAAGAVADGTLSIDGGGGLKVGVIQTGNIAAAAVTTAKLADSTGAADGVTTAKLATGAVTTAKITDANVTLAKLNSDVSATRAQVEAQTASKLIAASLVKYSPAVPKAYGVILIEATRSLETGSYNTTSVTRIGADDTTVTLTDDMADGNYTVLVSPGVAATGSSAPAIPRVYDRAAGSFKIEHSSEATGKKLHFVVFGTLAT